VREQKGTRSISDIVSIVHCERQAYFDRMLGRHRTGKVDAFADEGTRQHSKFETEGLREIQRGDKRCFIATAVYGEEAMQTLSLRAWRDTALCPRPLGRLFVRLYYVVSPPIARLADQSPILRAVIRRALDVFVRWVAFR
jgi:hypothetical protein